MYITFIKNIAGFFACRFHYGCRRLNRLLIDKINRQNPASEFANFTPHCLRHTFATNCIAKGMKPKALQKILGHKYLQITMDLYCHVLDDAMRDEMSLVLEMVWKSRGG